MARILVVDDEPQMCRLLREALERAGYTVDDACDGLHALSRFAANQPDLVITDIIMPQREGLETIQALRRKCPSLPIIAISGGGRQSPDNYLTLASNFGANRVFAKPFRVEDVLSAVATLTARPPA
jgi:CheY-like chemotaxis protein